MSALVICERGDRLTYTIDVQYRHTRPAYGTDIGLTESAVVAV